MLRKYALLSGVKFSIQMHKLRDFVSYEQIEYVPHFLLFVELLKENPFELDGLLMTQPSLQCFFPL
jgi:hypothetical protein